MNSIIIPDKHNPVKGHHVKFKGSQVFYNQAINQGAIKRPHKASKPTTSKHGTTWADFYNDENVTHSTNHGYQSYIDEAKKMQNNITAFRVNYFSRIRQAQAQGASFKTCAMFAFLASYQEWLWARKRLALANKGRADKAIAMRLLNQASARMQQRKQTLDRVRGK